MLGIVLKFAGKYPSPFSIIPSTSQENLINVVDKLGWTGLYKIGKPNNDICGVKVEKNMLGFVSFGGVNPFA
ncbi:DUF128 domain-containing protein, partial [Methanothermococcus sp. SCGC AD-155-C09]|nr:DUF128 domain-containing protein [Methanothermococcus sp. SCGC AD-155-C09]